MKQFIYLCVVLSTCVPCLAQDEAGIGQAVAYAPYVTPALTGGNESALMQGEIIRRGDMVEHIVDGVYQSGTASQYEEAMRPPASDADKWFISILTTKTCPGCEQLKKDWVASSHLLALGHPEPAKSWSHFNVYHFEDGSQNWRFGGVKITRVPTILVQPPRSGKYGDPGTVVFQGYYNGNPKDLADSITSAIKLYLSKLTASQADRERSEPGGKPPVAARDCPGPNCPTPSPYQPQPQPSVQPNNRPLPWLPRPNDDANLLDLFPKNNPVDVDVNIPPLSAKPWWTPSVSTLIIVFVIGLAAPTVVKFVWNIARPKIGVGLDIAALLQQQLVNQTQQATSQAAQQAAQQAANQAATQAAQQATTQAVERAATMAAERAATLAAQQATDAIMAEQARKSA